jgi:hypothetical protein
VSYSLYIKMGGKGRKGGGKEGKFNVFLVYEGTFLRSHIPALVTLVKPFPFS